MSRNALRKALLIDNCNNRICFFSITFSHFKCTCYKTYFSYFPTKTRLEQLKLNSFLIEILNYLKILQQLRQKQNPLN